MAALEKQAKRRQVRKLGVWQYLILVVSGVGFQSTGIA